MTENDKSALAGRLSSVGMVTPTLAEGQSGQVDTVRDIETITGEILEAQRAGGQAIIDIGNRLIEAKAMLNHGKWLPWLADKVGYSESTAQNFMRLARKYTNPQLVGDLGMRKALALLALPDADREGFVAENNVIDMTSRELEKAIKERDEARKAAEQAQADTRAAQEARHSMEEHLKTANDLASRAQEEKEQTAAHVADLEKQLAELKAQPTEVAVMAVDQEAIEKAKAEAVAELQDKLDKAKEAKKKSDEKRKNAEAAVESLKQSMERMEKAQKQAAAMSDPDIAKAEVYFNEGQEIANKLRGILLKVRSREEQTTAGKLANAITALADQIRRCAE